MTYAIAVEFDIESTEKIRQKIIKIVQSNINPYMLNNRISPHLTISLFEIGDEILLNKRLEDICLKVSKERIQISGVGMFEPKVVYYEPIMSDFLIGLNKVITSMLVESGIKPDQYYLPGKWVPHIALGVQLTLDELIKAIDIIKKDFQPFDVVIEKIVLARCNPYKEIVQYTI